MPEERKPCPFCKSGEIESTYGGQDYAYIYCELCSARGPRAPDEDEAWRLWNQRWIPTEGE